MKIIKSILSLTAALMALNACGKDGGKSDSNNQEFGCPAAFTVPYHKVNIETEDALPNKIAIEMDGDIKYDECLEENVILPPPIVKAERYELGVSVVVQHFGAFEVLPESITFKILDRGSCSTNDIFFQATNTPLEFQNVYPNGPNCGVKTFAETTIRK